MRGGRLPQDRKAAMEQKSDSRDPEVESDVTEGSMSSTSDNNIGDIMPSTCSNTRMEGSRMSPKVIGRTIFRIFFINRQFMTLLLYNLIPATNALVPLFYSGQIPNESALAIVSQYMFVSIVLEVIQEAVVNSLYYLVGRDYERRRQEALQSLKVAVAILFTLGLVLCGLVVGFTKQMVAMVNTPDDIVDATQRYLYVSAFSFPVFLVNAAVVNHLQITTHAMMLTSSLLLVITTTLLNVFLFGRQDASLHWNVDQLGFYKVISVSCELLINSTTFFIIEKMTPIDFFFRVPFFAGLKQKLRSILNVSWGNFGDSLIRNFFYFTVTLSFINHLGSDESGAWNLFNTIVWTLLLIPSIALASYVKICIGRHANQADLLARVKEIFWETLKAMAAWLIVVSTLSALFWSDLAQFFSPNNKAVQEISLKMFRQVGWVFLIFTASNAMSGFFLGIGKTKYVFFISIISNVSGNFIVWILFLSSVIHPDYWIVMGLYIFGMVVTFILNIGFGYKLYWNLSQRRID